MAEVAVLGMGAMGSTLARVLLERGHEVSVWNRSASERAAAVAAEQVLDEPGVLDALAGRAFVQLTNGTEEQVRSQLARVRAAGGRMLAGGILGYPRHIGCPKTVIMYAGDAAVFDEHAATLAGLAGSQRYYGEDPGPPNAVYVAAFGFYFAALAGFLEAAALAASRGVPPAEFAAAMPGMAALLLDHVDDAARRIERGDYAGDQATVDVHLVGSERRRRTLEDAGLQALMTGAFVEYCRLAQAAGDGGEDIAALFKRVGEAGP